MPATQFLLPERTASNTGNCLDMILEYAPFLISAGREDGRSAASELPLNSNRKDEQAAKDSAVALDSAASEKWTLVL